MIILARTYQKSPSLPHPRSFDLSFPPPARKLEIEISHDSWNLSTSCTNTMHHFLFRHLWGNRKEFMLGGLMNPLIEPEIGHAIKHHSFDVDIVLMLPHGIFVVFAHYGFVSSLKFQSTARVVLPPDSVPDECTSRPAFATRLASEDAGLVETPPTLCEVLEHRRCGRSAPAYIPHVGRARVIESYLWHLHTLGCSLVK